MGFIKTGSPEKIEKVSLFKQCIKCEASVEIEVPILHNKKEALQKNRITKECPSCHSEVVYED